MFRRGLPRAILGFARLGALDRVRACVEELGVDVNAVSYSDGTTALHRASQGGHAAVVEYLLSIGANVNARDMHGRTPLILAAGSGTKQRIDLVRLLLSRGAFVNAVDTDGNSALFAAIRNGDA